MSCANYMLLRVAFLALHRPHFSTDRAQIYYVNCSQLKLNAISFVQKN